MTIKGRLLYSTIFSLRVLLPKNNCRSTYFAQDIFQTRRYTSVCTPSNLARTNLGTRHFPLRLSFSRRMASSDTNSKSCKVGIVQMTCTPDKQCAFSQAKQLIKKAKDEGAKVVFLPEACDYIGNSREYTMASAEPMDGDIMQRYKELASQLGLWISIGGLHVKDENDLRMSNTHVMLNDKGELVGQYAKTHLFNVDIPGKVRLQETDFTRPGDTIGPPVDTPAGKVGLAIDMRFPELSLALRRQGAEILTYPSAFTVPTGKAHWEVLLRARAIENQCYVIAAAQVGQHHPKRASYGHAMVVDPWGVVLADLGEEIGVQVVDINLESLHNRRMEMPIETHRRHDLYGHVTVNPIVNIDSVSVYQFGQVQVPSSCVFYRTPLSFAFVNKKPVIPGHVLVSPVRVAERYDDLTEAEVADLAQTVQIVSKQIEKHFNCTSRTIGMQDGPNAGQSIWHVHCHILPRKGGDFKRNDDIYEELEKHDKDVDASQWRTVEEMSTEAMELRQLFT